MIIIIIITYDVEELQYWQVDSSPAVQGRSAKLTYRYSAIITNKNIKYLLTVILQCALPLLYTGAHDRLCFSHLHFL